MCHVFIDTRLKYVTVYSGKLELFANEPIIAKLAMVVSVAMFINFLLHSAATPIN